MPKSKWKKSQQFGSCVNDKSHHHQNGQKIGQWIHSTHIIEKYYSIFPCLWTFILWVLSFLSLRTLPIKWCFFSDLHTVVWIQMIVVKMIVGTCTYMSANSKRYGLGASFNRDQIGRHIRPYKAWFYVDSWPDGQETATVAKIGDSSDNPKKM